MFKFNYCKNQLVVLSLEILCEEKRLLVMASRSAVIISHQEVEKHRVLNRQPHSLGGLRCASNRTPDQSSGRPEANTCCERPRATCGNKITRMPKHKDCRKIWGCETAYHKGLNEDLEPRLHHRDAVIVQDLATHWIQSYPYKIKSAQEKHSYVQKKTQESFIRTILWHSSNPAQS